MPAPARTYAAPASTGCACTATTTASATTPASTRALPHRIAVTWDTRAPSLAWAWLAAAHTMPTKVSASPARPGPIP